MPHRTSRLMRRILPATIVAVIVSMVFAAAAFAGNAITIQRAIASYEGTALNTVHITQVLGGASGSGRGWDCQSWWRWNGGTVFYSYSMQWSYPFTYTNNGGTVRLGSANTNGVAC